jgi:hypothetical protein
MPCGSKYKYDNIWMLDYDSSPKRCFEKIGMQIQRSIVKGWNKKQPAISGQL